MSNKNALAPFRGPALEVQKLVTPKVSVLLLPKLSAAPEKVTAAVIFTPLALDAKENGAFEPAPGLVPDQVPVGCGVHKPSSVSRIPSLSSSRSTLSATPSLSVSVSGVSKVSSLQSTSPPELTSPSASGKLSVCVSSNVPLTSL